MSPRHPDFVIIGAQKAASTLLLNSLRSHPEAWLPAEEEPYFRDPVYDPDLFGAFAAPYSGRPERRLGLKCPDYLARPEVPARLAAVLDLPDLVVCLRDPVARAVSAYFWRVRWGLLPVLPIEEGMRRILDGELREYDPTVGEVLDWGRYGHHLDRYLQHFPREKLFVLIDEDLRRTPDRTVNEVSRFLGISQRGVGEVGRRGSNEGVYSLPRLHFLQRRARLVLQWNSDRTYASIPKSRRIDRRLYNLAIAGIDEQILARVYGNPRPVLSDELDQALRDYYRDDVRRVETLVDRDLGWTDSAHDRRRSGQGT